MPKNKGKYASREPAVVAPNEELLSLTGRVLQWLAPHKMKILGVTGGVVVVLIAISIWSWYDKRRATNATRSFAVAIETLKAEVGEPDAVDPLQPKPKDAPLRFTTAKERSEAALAAFVKLEKDYAKAGAAKQARLIKAGLLYDLARYDEAVAEYERYLKVAPDSELRTVAREGLGYAQEARALAQKDATAQAAGLDEALRTFEQLQPDDKGYYRDMALYHQGRIRASKGQRDEALQLFRQALDKTTSQSLRKQINNRIALLEEQG